MWSALFDTVRRYRIPERYFHEMIDGVTSDLVTPRRRTFDGLYRYCYCVASVARLLARIESRDFEVLSERVRLSTPEKLGILARAWLRGK